MTTPTDKPPAQLPDSEFNKPWDLANNYQTVRKSNDPRFGEVMILSNKDKSLKEFVFAKEKWSTSKVQATKDIQDLQTRKELNGQNIQEFLGYSTAIDKQLCSTNYLVCGYYRFPKSDLAKALADHTANNSGFSGSELAHINSEVLNGLKSLHSRGVAHGDIRPQLIGYDRDAHDVRLLDRLKDSSAPEKTQANHVKNKEEVYVSPQLHAKLNGKDVKTPVDVHKNDLYAAGLTTLALGLQTNLQDVYQPKGQFDQDKLNRYVSEFEAKYGAEQPGLVKKVKESVAEKEEDRVNVETTNFKPGVQKTVTVNSALPPVLGMSYDQPSGNLISVTTLEGKPYTYLTRTAPSSNAVYNYDNSGIVYVNAPQSSTPVYTQSSTPVYTQSTAPVYTQSTAPVYTQSTTPVTTQSYTPIVAQTSVNQSYNPQTTYSNYPTTYTSYAPSVNSFVTPPTTKVSDVPFSSTITNYQQPTSRNGSVEIRRSSSIPLSGQKESVIKNYVMRGDQLVEVQETLSSQPILLQSDQPVKTIVTETVVHEPIAKVSEPKTTVVETVVDPNGVTKTTVIETVVHEPVVVSESKTTVVETDGVKKTTVTETVIHETITKHSEPKTTVVETEGGVTKTTVVETETIVTEAVVDVDQIGQNEPEKKISATAN